MPDPDHTVLAAECGKGTYVRALARDLGRDLDCFGHVVALRRTAVGPFAEDCAVALERLHEAAQAETGAAEKLAATLQPVEAALAALPALAVSQADAGRLARGQAVLSARARCAALRRLGRGSCQARLVALAEAEKGELRPRRIFNWHAEASQTRPGKQA